MNFAMPVAKPLVIAWIASLLVLVIMGLLPYVTTAVGWIGLATNTGSPAWCWAAGIVGALAIVMQMSVIVRFYKLIVAKPALAWTYPFGCAIAAIAVTRSLIHLLAGKKVIWKGTPYSGANQA